MPYLQCEKFVFRTLEVGKKSELMYTIKNYGNYPAKILNRRLWLFFVPSIPDNIFQESDFKNIKGTDNVYPLYINKENPQEEVFTANDQMTKEWFEGISNKTLNIYFFGEMEYLNQITGKKRFYQFHIRIPYVPKPTIGQWKILYNENIDIK